MHGALVCRRFGVRAPVLRPALLLVAQLLGDACEQLVGSYAAAQTQNQLWLHCDQSEDDILVGVLLTC